MKENALRQFTARGGLIPNKTRASVGFRWLPLFRKRQRRHSDLPPSCRSLPAQQCGCATRPLCRSPRQPDCKLIGSTVRRHESIGPAVRPSPRRDPAGRRKLFRLAWSAFPARRTIHICTCSPSCGPGCRQTHRAGRVPQKCQEYHKCRLRPQACRFSRSPRCLVAQPARPVKRPHLLQNEEESKQCSVNVCTHLQRRPCHFLPEFLDYPIARNLIATKMLGAKLPLHSKQGGMTQLQNKLRF